MEGGMRIVLDLSDASSLDGACERLDEYMESLRLGTARAVDTACLWGEQYAAENFGDAEYPGVNDVSVFRTVDAERLTGKVIAEGDSVAFIEFGTGVVYPDTHPDAAAAGAVRGGYGLGRGSDPGGWDYWGTAGTSSNAYYRKNGKVHTYGNPANACLYTAARDVENQFGEIIREVFGHE